jgi:hypothetical protein
MYDPQPWHNVLHAQPASMQFADLVRRMDIGLAWEEERISRKGNRVLSANNYEAMQNENHTGCNAVWTTFVKAIISPDDCVLYYSHYVELRTGLNA